MQHLGKYFLIVLTIFCLSCTNRNTVKRIKVNNYFVEGNFINGNTIDGNAKYYDSVGVLYNITTYDKGIKSGISIDYYPNGTVSDSVSFFCGKETGYWNRYDSIGSRVYANFYYCGLPYGPELLFKRNKLIHYYFTDFDRNTIVRCNYDSLGQIDSIGEFKMMFTLKSLERDSLKQLNMFAYLPVLPHTEQAFSIGLTNKSNVNKELFPIVGRRDDFFIDTILAVPPRGWYYYLACNIRANNGAINKYYIEEMIY